MTRLLRPRPLRAAAPVALVVAASLAGCGGGGGAGDTASISGPKSCDPKQGGTLVVALTEDLPTFDSSENPIVGPTAFIAAPLVFDRLVRPTSDLKTTEPQLAESIDHNADFTQWTIHLRQGVKFQDGSTFDAKDVVFSLNYNLKGFNGYALGPVSNITAVDSSTVRVDFKSPYADFLTEGLATWLSGFIYPDDFGGQSAQDFFKRPIGTGPYKVASYEPGTGVTYERNPDYWQTGRPYIERIELKIVPDSNARILGLENGQFDFIDKVPADQVDSLSDGSLARVLDPTADTDALFLSSQLPLFADKEVREAISLALNRDDLAQGAYAGFAKPAPTLVPLALPDVEPPTKSPYSYDPDRAKELMAQSSHSNGGSVELTYIRGSANLELEAQLIQSQLSKIGIDVSLSSVGANEYFDLAPAGKLPFVLFEDSGVSPDPLDFLSFYVDSGGYYGDWPTAPVEKIVSGLEATDDSAKRTALLKQYENFTAKLLPQIPLISVQFLDAQSSDLSGLDIDPLNEARFADAWLCSGGS